MSYFLAGLIEVLAEWADDVFDSLFSEMIAKKILARMPNHEITSVFVPFDSVSFLEKGGKRMKKVTEMEKEGYRYLKRKRETGGNKEVGETIYFIRNVQG